MNETKKFDSGRLAQLRKLKGFTQEMLAKLSGVSRSQIGRLEVDNSDCTLATATSIARALGVPVDVLTVHSGQLFRQDTVFFSSMELEKWASVHELFRGAQRVVSVFRKIDSYLQDDEMLLEHNSGTLNCGNRRAQFMGYVQQRREVFHSKASHHMMVVPRELFSVKAICSEIWRRKFAESLNLLDRPSFINPVCEFVRLRKAITNQLPCQFHSWHKISTLDESALVFHFDYANGADVAISYDGDLARSIAETVFNFVNTNSVIKNRNLKDAGKRALNQNRKQIVRLLQSSNLFPCFSKSVRSLYPELSVESSNIHSGESRPSHF